MNVKELNQQVKAGAVKEVNLVSMEGGSYVIHALVEGTSVPVADDKGATLHVASVEEARRILDDVKDVRLFIAQPAVYEEMVGQPVSQTDSREEIPLRSKVENR
ncbi:MULTISPECIES: DUF6482 family protein [Pseudomonadaceae]|jgi:uncharacterized protein (DUF39 family)|uniref:DUF6482 family protein n=1 Tax=Pseudomonadaceae TaxID=135621 RepID=UPI0003FC5C06|nr:MULTISPECIES: DUF6482 family protein [Pseudomonas]HCV75765.1 cation transporter [Pseudomonas sp.]KTT55938.1 cation transporter [Pseudomonas psychrotolerans]MBH3328045.1 cation transporter [Pseudomonas oryzihabitans]MCI1011177.1 cation transporter [Pseudomonas oryzihabitans]NMZ64820.1 cation transporter [Pseudomonas oryzihabitans]